MAMTAAEQIKKEGWKEGKAGWKEGKAKVK